MDYVPSLAGAIVAFAVAWLATGYQYHLYRRPEHRVPPDGSRATLIRRAGIALLAAVAVALAVRPDHYDAGPALLVALFSLVLLVMASTDIERRLLPNRIMYPALIAALAVSWAWPDRSATDAFIGAGLGFGIAAGLFLIGQGFGALLGIRATPFGLGDVKLIVLIGLLVGWPALLSALFIGIIAAGVPALVMTLLGHGKQVFPYGPFLIFGALVPLLWPGPFV